MKKQFVILTALFALLQYGAYSQAVNLNDNFATIGVGMPVFYNVPVSPGLKPAIRLSYEIGKFEIGPGVVSIGGILGGSQFKETEKHLWEWDQPALVHRNYTVTRNYLNLVLAARSAWYYNFGQLGLREVNAWAGASLGLRYTIIFENYNGDTSTYYDKKPSYAKPHFAGFVGASYAINANWSAFVEAGYDVSWLLIGMVYRFN